ncbi:MAG: hypothetical protein RMK99_16975, partial [Anaerolineales bacterium]|nr:hypothetical protein [Anaerolineales bacterium]
MADSADDKIEVGDISDSKAIAIGAGAIAIYNEAAVQGVVGLHQLPPPPPDFTGRDIELAQLLEDVETGGVTILGVRGQGGVGKTALALKLAERLLPRYPDAQFFLDLRGVSDSPLTPAEALAHVLRAYHPTAKLPESETELRAAYLSVLHGRRALLLLDNARDAEQVRPLLPPAGCLLLVTSRSRFTLPGLRACDLDELPPADAAALVRKIAPRAGERAGDLAALCGYLPLALRLTAGLLAERADLSADDVLRRLRDTQKRLALTGVAASLRLSYDLLNAELQRRWRALAVFPATFDRAAARAVWGMEDDEAAQDALGELVRVSMLDFRAGRYGLHDLSRDFARAQCSAEEMAQAQLRHAEHYKGVLSAADELYLQGNENVLRGLALFDLERAHIEAGQKWAASPDLRGLGQSEALHDPTGLSEAAAHLCNDYPDAGAYVLALRLHPHERIRWLEDGLKAARQLKNRSMEGNHLGNLG